MSQSNQIIPVVPEVKNKIDLTLLSGYWKLSSQPKNYYSLYFGENNVFRQDNSGVWPIDLSGTWKTIGDSTVQVTGSSVPANFFINKLSKDSLVITVSNVIFRHLRLAVVESKYALSTLAEWIYWPKGIAEDNDGNIYVAEHIDERIKMISAVDQRVSIVVGIDLYYNPVIGLINRLEDITMDEDNNLVVVAENRYLKRISLKNKTIVNIPVNYSGSNTDPNMRYRPYAIKVDKEGNLYEAEGFYARVRKIEKTTGKIRDLIGMKNDPENLRFNPNPGTGLNAYIIPQAICLDHKGNLFVADGYSHCIWKYDLLTGDLKLIAGKGVAGFEGDGQLAINAKLNNPQGIAIDEQGNIFISDTGNSRIRKISVIDNKISTIAGSGLSGYNGEWSNSLLGKLNYPTSIYVETDGDIVFIDAMNKSVRKLTLKKSL